MFKLWCRFAGEIFFQVLLPWDNLFHVKEMVILTWNSTSAIPSPPSFYNSYRDSKHKLHHDFWKHIVSKNEIFFQIFTAIFSRNSWLYVLVSFVLAEIFPQFCHKICISLIFSILFSILQSCMRNVSVSHAFLHFFFFHCNFFKCLIFFIFLLLMDYCFRYNNSTVAQVFFVCLF